MRMLLPGLASAVLIGVLASPAFAGPLEEKKYETSFSFNYDDTDNFGKTITLDGQFDWILAKGRHELGAKTSYINFDPDTGDSSDSLLIGPAYTFNWSPSNDTATGFVGASYLFASGDLGDTVDAALEGTVGAKVFVGDSANIRLEGYFRRLMGASGFDDEDSMGIRVGLGILFGK
jgi:hypothetical protein